MHFDLPLAECALGKINRQFSASDFPILDAGTAHVGHGETGWWQEFQRINTGLFHVQRQRMRDDQSRFFQPRIHAVGDGTFIVDGRKIDRKTMMRSKIPAGI